MLRCHLAANGLGILQTLAGAHLQEPDCVKPRADIKAWRVGTRREFAGLLPPLLLAAARRVNTIVARGIIFSIGQQKNAGKLFLVPL